MTSAEQREIRIELWTMRLDRDGIELTHPEQMPEDWTAAVYTRASRTLFGLTYFGQPTHMAYELGDGPGCLDPADAIERAKRMDHERFYFDAGSNGRPIWATYDELARVFVDLGLLPRADEGASHNTTSGSENQT